MNSEMGTKKEPGIIAGRRYSGFLTPFFSERYFSRRSEVEPRTVNPISEPMPMPKYESPTEPCENPYWPSKTSLMVVNKR